MTIEPTVVSDQRTEPSRNNLDVYFTVVLLFFGRSEVSTFNLFLDGSYGREPMPSPLASQPTRANGARIGGVGKMGEVSFPR